MKKPKTPKLVTVAIFTTITVIFWVFFEVYEALSDTPDIQVSENLLSPVNPQLDLQSLQQIETRMYIDENEVVDFLLPNPDVTVETESEIEEDLLLEDEVDLNPSSPTPSATFDTVN